MSPAASLEAIADNHADLRDVTGKGMLTIKGADGDSVRFDVVYVLAPPNRARVRAWKFGRAVFDLTWVDGEAWLFASSDDRGEELAEVVGDFGDALGEWLAIFAGDLRGDNGTAEARSDVLTVRRPMAEGLTLSAEIDRPTLTPRRYDVLDATGRTRFSLALDGYREIGPAVWPSVIEATSEAGTVRVRADDLNANVAPPTAFEPPRRATQLP